MFENVDGSFPVQGALAYTTNKNGAVGFSTVTADGSGNLTIPGTTVMGPNGGYVTVNGETGLLTANQDVEIYGKLSVYNNAEVNALNLVNTGDNNVISQLDDRITAGVETLTWSNAAGIAEPISGWNAKLTPAALIFRTVDISGLTGATLIMAQNQNNLLTLFQQRGVFLTQLTNDPTLAAVFNTSVSITFRITPIAGGLSVDLTYPLSGNPAVIVPYTTIVSFINSLAAASLPLNTLTVSYSPAGTTGTITFTIASGYRLQFVDSTTNGTAQLFLNHIGTTLLTNTPYTTSVTANVKDTTVVMPSTPTAAPTIVDGTIDVSNCTISIPTLPLTTSIAIQNVGVYWCLSGSAFSSSPNALIPTSQRTYRITGLVPGSSYNVALSYRSAYDESPRGPVLTFTTQLRSAAQAMSSNINVYAVEVTEDVNWLPTPSYGTTVVNYGKQYLSNVRFTVATVFSAIWTDTLADLTNISQIQSVTMEVYAGASTAITGARFYTGNNPLTNILYASSDPIDAKYGDVVGLGGSIDIYPDATGINILRNIFNADVDGNIGVGKNMVFGWYSTKEGLRNCEVTRFSVVYTV